MKILINALSQVGAGSRTYLQNVLPRLSRLDKNSLFIVLWPSGKTIPKELLKTKNIYLKKVNVPQKPSVFRLLYEQIFIPIISKNF
ncbi:MAG: hypothetical protein ACTSRG_25280, partial [Candidatus Helarchaeota archaeon]